MSELSLFHLSPEDLKCVIGLDVCSEKDKAVEGGGWGPRAGEAVGGQGSCLSCWTQVAIAVGVLGWTVACT